METPSAEADPSLTDMAFLWLRTRIGDGALKQAVMLSEAVKINTGLEGITFSDEDQETGIPPTFTVTIASGEVTLQSSFGQCALPTDRVLEMLTEPDAEMQIRQRP